MTRTVEQIILEIEEMIEYWKNEKNNSKDLKEYYGGKREGLEELLDWIKWEAEE